jgi:hypothetical protein
MSAQVNANQTFETHKDALADGAVEIEVENGKHHASPPDCDSENELGTGGRWTSSERNPTGLITSIYFPSTLSLTHWFP